MNKFKDPKKRAYYDSCINHYKNRTYFFVNETEYRGSSDRAAFWAGYHNTKDGVRTVHSGDPASITYPAYRAGQDCGKGEA